MSSLNSADSAVGAGNTITAPVHKQIIPSKNWCFTLNNYIKEDIKKISSNSAVKFYIIGEEVGESGTPHLQGYIEFIKKVRPKSVFENDKIHWQKRRGTREDNYIYCSKDGKFISNIPRPEPVKTITTLRPWQKKIEDLILTEPNDRVINWYWEPNGNIGKSAFCKYLCVKYNAVILSNKACDMKHGIVKFMEMRNGIAPKIIIIDIPRSVDSKFISYTGYEEIKNGCFFSPKFESQMVLFNSPHLLIFSNEEPMLDMMSADRWNVQLIED